MLVRNTRQEKEGNSREGCPALFCGWVFLTGILTQSGEFDKEARINLNRIRELREAKGLTQTELGEMVGVNQSTIDKYESGIIVPPLHRAFKLTYVLGCEMQDLVDTTSA